MDQAYSELKAEQEELIANATAYESIALDVSQEVSGRIPFTLCSCILSDHRRPT